MTSGDDETAAEAADHTSPSDLIRAIDTSPAPPSAPADEQSTSPDDELPSAEAVPLVSGDPLLTGPVPAIARAEDSHDVEADESAPLEIDAGSHPDGSSNGDDATYAASTASSTPTTRSSRTPDVGPDLLVPFERAKAESASATPAPGPEPVPPAPPAGAAVPPPPPTTVPPPPPTTTIPTAATPTVASPAAAPSSAPSTTAQRAVRATRPTPATPGTPPAAAGAAGAPAPRQRPAGPPSGATPRIVSRRPRVRRVTRVVRHVDPWSMFKIAAVFSFVAYGIALVAGVLLWQVAYATGTIDNIERGMESTGWETFELNGGEIFHNAWIAGLFAAVGLIGLAVLFATIFNLVTDLVGGVRMTVLEEEVVERAPRAPKNQRSARRQGTPPAAKRSAR